MSDLRYVTPKRKGRLTLFAGKVARLHAEANDLNLYVTGRVIHEAVKAVGWEIAEQIENTPTRLIYDEDNKE